MTDDGGWKAMESAHSGSNLDGHGWRMQLRRLEEERENEVPCATTCGGGVGERIRLRREYYLRISSVNMKVNWPFFLYKINLRIQ